jgi:Protein of unknown function (DUF4012)
VRVSQISWLMIAFGAVLLSAGLLRTALTVNSLWGHLGQAQALADSPKDILPQAACELVLNLRNDIVSIQQDAGALVSFAPTLGWLPGVGGDLRAAPQLLATADGLTEAGAITCSSLAPVLDALSNRDGALKNFSLEQLTQSLAANQANLNRAALAADRAQAAWVSVDQSQLSSSIARRAKLLDRGLPLLRAGLGLLSVAPDLLGANGQRTYLLIAQNEDELRPTGGYITGVGEVRIQNGQIISMTFRDSYAVDDFSQPYPYPPAPLYQYMKIDQWVLRDSNWSPDFPTTARQIIEAYRPGYKIDIDGVIALDQAALQEIIGGLGPLSVKGVDTPITGDNIIEYIRRSWASPDATFSTQWWLQRKSFMGPLADAAWERIKTGQFNPVALGQATIHALDQKHLLLYLRNERAATVLAEHAWDGALPQLSGDGLMVVDANIGYNKSNPRIKESILYQLDLRPAFPQATLTLTYTHTSQVNYPCKPEIRYDLVYEQAMDRCYFDFIRVYAPPASQLVDATRIPIPGSALYSGKSELGNVTPVTAENGWTVFQVMSVLPTATTQTRAFTWTLPPSIVRVNQSEGWYSLRVYKQPGTLGHALTVQVRLPEASTLLDALPEQITQNGAWVILQTTLDRDQNLTLHWRR